MRKNGLLVRFSMVVLVSALFTWCWFVYGGMSSTYAVTDTTADSTTSLSGPVVSEITPPPGSVTDNASPVFSLRFSDHDELDPGVVIRIDNQSIASTISWDGKYVTEYDSCTGEEYSVRVGDDYTGGVVTAQFSRLSGGQHTVFYSLKDRLGNVTENSYNFTVSDTQAPVISEKTPVDRSITASPKPTIKAKITDINSVDPSKVYMKFNGISVAAAFDAIQSVISYTVPQPLKNGTYQVEVGASDIFGNASVSTWSFSLNETSPPSITNLTPSDGSVTGKVKPVIEASLSDISGITNPVFLQIDGQNFEVQYQSDIGKVSYVPLSSLADGNHSVSLSVYDSQGNRATAAWAFTVYTQGPYVTNLTPVPETVTDKDSPLFSLRFNTDHKLDPNVVIKVDNQNVTPTITWDGLYVTEYDSCTGEPYDVWAGNDYTKGVVSAQLPRLSGGQHTIYYSLKDQLGNVTEKTYTITISDTRGPQITDMTPVSGTVSADPKPVIKVKISDTNSIVTSQVVMKLNGTPVTAAYDAVTSFVTYSVPQPLKNGIYQVEVSASDIFGNASVSTWSFSVNDNTPPSITNLVPSNGSLTGNVKPLIEANVSDLSGISNPAYFQIDGINLEGEYKSQTGKASYLPVTPLNPGQHTVSMYVYDFQGNKASAAWAFSVALTGPAVTDVTPSPESVIANLIPQFSARFDDPHNLDPAVVIKVDNQTVTSVIQWDGIYSTEYDSCTGEAYQVRTGDDYTKGVVTAQLPQLSGGQHTLYYCLKDRLGNVTEDSYTFTVSDTQGPQITMFTPVDGSTITDPKPVIKAKVTDINGIPTSQIVMIFNGTPVVSAYDLASSTISYAVPGPLKNGIQRVQLTAPDMLGNVTSVTWSFTVSETNPPVISNLVPANNSTLGPGKTMIEANLSDISGINNPVYLQIDGQGVEVNYNAQTGKVSYMPATPLTQGTHNVVMTVYDFQSNKATASWSFAIESSGPSVSGVSPTPEGVTPSLRPLFSLKFNDPNKVDSSGVVKIDGNTVTSTVNFEGIYRTEYDSCTGESYDVLIGYDYTKGSLTANLSQLSLGKHTIYYCIKDTLGNITQSTYDFTVSDTQGPEVVEKSPADGATIGIAKPMITARLSEPNLIVAETVYLTVNGQRVNSTYDQNAHTVKYQPAQMLSSGQNIIQLSAADELGNVSLTTWSFSINDITAPMITLLTPAPNTVTADFSPTISAKITDENGIDPNRVVLSLNEEVVGTFNPANGIVSYKPGYSLADGTYSVALAVYDVFDNSSTANWSFVVRDSGAPLITNLLPPPTMGTRATKPKISASVTDTGGLDVNRLTLTVDGVPLDVIFSPDRPGSIVGGTVSAVPATDLSSAMHTAVVTVFDKAGNSQKKTWQFGVNTFVEMSAETIGGCVGCHNEGITSLEKRHVAGSGDCGLCHGRGLGYAHGDADCSQCHGGHGDYWPPAVGSIPCTQCHNSQYWDVVPTHGGPLVVTPQHNYDAMGEQCLACHFSSLTKEHNVYVEGRGAAYNCATCHQSSDLKVKEAIAGHNSACVTCHGDKANHQALHQIDINPACAECHANNLETDHIVNRPNRGLNCETCHPGNTNPSNKQCSECHSEGHGISLSKTVPSDIPLYSGVEWSEPINVGIFAGESWVPEGDSSGLKLLMTRRSREISGSEVWNFYKNEMSIKGWTLDSPAPAADSDFYNVTFSKYTRKAKISFYGGENHDNSPKVESGYRIEILYN